MASGVIKLPLPKQPARVEEEDEEEEKVREPSSCRAPRYGARASSGFVPRAPEDFGDGGAYPEIHVAQYPQGLGKKEKPGAGNQVALSVGGDGQVRYDAIVKQGRNASKVVYSRYEDMVEKDLEVDELARPSKEEEEKTTQKTKEALQLLMTGKVANSRASHALKRPNQDPTYIKYTPSSANANHAGGAQHRVIRMVEVQQDPFEPPRFLRKKIPGGPASPPVPVMHSPPRKVTAADQQAWKIPPCVSNWKNSKGYTRPLDKLLAADGRGLQDPQINDNFAKVSEALYIAERVAREEVEERAAMEKHRSQKIKIAKEHDLRDMAEKLRNERTRGIVREDDDDDESDDEDVGVRDEIRDERRRERERDRRLEAAGKKTKLSRDQDRDVSEKIALGMATKTSEELQYDQRLFNQSAGMDSGFGDEDAYGIYDKPMMKGTSASMLYKPTKGDDEQYGGEERAQEDFDKLTKSSRFQPDKGFEGAGDRSSKRPRDNPVEFEKEADPFGLSQFLSEAKKGKKALDSVGQNSKGGLSAGAGGSDGTGSGRSKLEFDRR